MGPPSPRVPRGMVPPLGLNLHGRKGPNGEEVESRQAAAQADIQLHVSPKNLLSGDRPGLRDGAVTMAALVPSSTPCHWLLFLLLLFSGTAYVTDNRPAGSETGLSFRSASQLSFLLALPPASCFSASCLPRSDCPTPSSWVLMGGSGPEAPAPLQSEGFQVELGARG